MIKIATINCYRQTGFDNVKQKQICDFISREDLDIVLFQEINVDNTTFEEGVVSSCYTTYENNSVTGYGTAIVTKNHLNVTNHVRDTSGRAHFIVIENIFAVGNVYPRSGSEGEARQERENMFSQVVPSLLNQLPNRAKGIVGGDFNCVTRESDVTSDSLQNQNKNKISPSLKRLISSME